MPDTNRATANLRRLLMQQRALGPAAAATAAVVAPLPCSEHVHVLNGVGVTHGEKQRHVLCGLTMRKPTMRCVVQTIQYSILCRTQYVYHNARIKVCRSVKDPVRVASGHDDAVLSKLNNSSLHIQVFL